MRHSTSFIVFDNSFLIILLVTFLITFCNLYTKYTKVTNYKWFFKKSDKLTQKKRLENILKLKIKLNVATSDYFIIFLDTHTKIRESYMFVQVCTHALVTG